MREFLNARKTLVAAVILVVFVIIAMLCVANMFGCFGCNACGGCSFWGCFESVTDSCTDCIGCALGCD